MKKIIFTLLIFFPFISFAQEVLVGKAAGAWIGKKVIVKTLQPGFDYGYSGFIKVYDPHMSIFAELNNIFLPVEGSTILSSYPALVNQGFTIKAVIPLEAETVLELQSATLGRCFYKYPNDINPELFCLMPAENLKYPAGSICNRITSTTDKYVGTTTSATPLGDYIEIRKIEKSGVTVYEIKFNTYDTKVEGGPGLQVLFDDKTTLSKNADDHSSYMSGSLNTFEHSVIIRLTKDEIEKFKTNAVTDFKIYIYDQHLTTAQSDNVKQYMNCLTQ